MIVLVAGLLAYAAPALSQHLNADTDSTHERVFDLPLVDGPVQRVLYVTPSRPLATIVMLPGGDGDVGVERDGDLTHGDNFLVRTRGAWAKLGYAVLIPDAGDGTNLRGQRSSPGYAKLVNALIEFAHAKLDRPVFLLGTSQGSIAAVNGAGHAPAGALAGVVLTESVSRMGGSHETVFDADPGDVRVPALVVANRDDRCSVAPPEDAPRIAAAMTGSADVHVLDVSGGIDKSKRSCGSLSPHGYYGIEQEVIAAISIWLKAHS